MDNVSHVPEQFIEFANALLNVADLSLALDNEGLLEVHFVLIRKAGLFLQQLVLLLLRLMVTSGTRLRFVYGSPSGCCGCPLLLQGTTLNSLELF